MSRKTFTILAISAVLLIAGITYAVTKLYSPAPEHETSVEANGHFIENHPLIKAVPSDAAMVFCFKDFRRTCEFLGDTTSAFRRIAADKFNFLADGSFASLRKSAAVMSVHYSKDLPPLMIIGCPANAIKPAVDSITPADTSADLRRLFSMAEAEGLSAKVDEGLILISTSETLISSSARHLREGHSILESNGFTEVATLMRGDDALLFNNAYASNILDAFIGRKHRNAAGFLKEASLWTGFSIGKHSSSEVTMHGEILYGEDPACYMNILEAGASSSSVAEALPAHTTFAASMPVQNIGKYIKAFRSYQDAKIRLDRYESELADQKRINGDNAEDWARHLDIKEVAIADINLSDKLHQFVLIKPGNKKAAASTSNRAGYPRTLFGELFTGESEDTTAIINGWLAMGNASAIREYSEKMALEGSLKDCLSDNGLGSRLPQKNSGFWFYHSLGEDPSLLESNFAPVMRDGFRDVLRGVSFAPMTLNAVRTERGISLEFSLDRTSISKSKAPEEMTEDRDTTVAVPEGPFKVHNSGTGQVNTFYQNSHLSLCLQDENGKDIWGVPFKQKICGYVQEVDYFNNGKIQYLFCAGSQLYLIDRLGRFVGGFPVELGKSVTVGPEVYDFTGAKGYTAMVLMKGNTVNYMDLHGKTVDGWKGLETRETVKSLPELLEADGTRYWVTRTSRQTLVFPFLGGEPLVKGEGKKMIRPDSPVTPDGKGGVTAKCYDGKERSFNLTKQEKTK